MKVQEVILGAMARTIRWWQAAEIIGISVRQMRRWKRRYEQYGYDGLYDRRRGKPSPRRIAMEQAEPVLELYRERYAGCNVQHFHEKLVERHGVGLSYTWVKLLLQGAGLVAKRKQRGKHRRRRERRPLPGMLLHLDGSRPLELLHRKLNYPSIRTHRRLYLSVQRGYTASFLGKILATRRRHEPAS